MIYKFAADVVVIVHFLWIVFLICGVFLGRRYRPVRIIHLAGLSFAVIIELFGWYCPLTHLEVWLRERYGSSSSYSGSFIVHYIEKLVYLELSPALIFVATLAIAACSLYLYVRKKD
ncbi:MAG: DUF2784 domain-containing protein [Thermodesulfovibrionales bacterium]|jgi:hypothetical protein